MTLLCVPFLFLLVQKKKKKVSAGNSAVVGNLKNVRTWGMSPFCRRKFSVGSLTLHMFGALR